jgi:hypothetical protein
MGTESMKIVIGADISNVTSSMKVAASSISQFGDSAAKAFDEVAAGAAAMQRVSDLIDKLAAEALGAGDKMSEGFQQPIKTIAQLEAEIENLETEIRNASDFTSLKKLNDELGRTKTQLNNLKVVGFESSIGKIGPSAVGAANGFNKLTPAVKAGNFALTDINRVIQDLPFGFIGIQNNLTELPGKFRALSLAAKESGQSVGKVLLSSLIGAGGIGTALSLITSALTFATVGFGAWTRGLSGSGSAAKKAAGDTDELSKILQEVGGEVGKSAARITTLFNALSSGALNTEQRKKALDELKQQNVEFFGSLKEEKGIIEGLELAYSSYLLKIKEIATAKAIEAQLTKLFDKRLELELSVDPKFVASTSKTTQTLIGKLKTQLNQLGGPVDVQKEQIDLSKGLNDSLRQRLDLQTRIAKLQSAQVVDLSGSKQQIEQIDLQIKGLVELQKVTGNFDISGSKEKQKQGIDLLKKRLEALERIKDVTEDVNALVGIEEQIFDLKVKITLRDAAKNGLSKEETDIAIRGFRSQLQKAFENQGLALEAIPKVRFRSVSVVELPTDIESKIAKAAGLDKRIPTLTIPEINIKLFGIKKGTIINETEKIIEDLSKSIRQALQQGIADAFSGIGEAFGEAIATGDFGNGLKKAAQSILSVLGGVMQTIGKEVIVAAIKIKLLKEALKKFAIKNPALAVLAGIGLIAAGAALKNIKFDGPKFAEGGIVTGPVIGQIGEKFKPEVVIPLERLPQLFRSMGGDSGSGLQFIPIINNEGLYLAMKRGERRTGRKF